MLCTHNCGGLISLPFIEWILGCSSHPLTHWMCSFVVRCWSLIHTMDGQLHWLTGRSSDGRFIPPTHSIHQKSTSLAINSPVSTVNKRSPVQRQSVRQRWGWERHPSRFNLFIYLGLLAVILRLICSIKLLMGILALCALEHDSVNIYIYVRKCCLEGKLMRYLVWEDLCEFKKHWKCLKELLNWII